MIVRSVGVTQADLWVSLNILLGVRILRDPARRNPVRSSSVLPEKHNDCSRSALPGYLRRYQEVRPER